MTVSETYIPVPTVEYGPDYYLYVSLFAVIVYVIFAVVAARAMLRARTRRL